MNSLKIAIILILLLVIYSCSSKNKVENLGILSEKQIKFKKTLEDMKEILDCNNLPFFLYHGTALGAHREKQFIEHDEDIDIGILEKDYCNAIEILDKYKSKFQIILSFPKNEQVKNSSELTYIHNETGVRIDIFKIIHTESGYIHYTYSDLCNEKKNKRCEFINDFEFENITFLGKSYVIPNIKFLISNYGNDWNVVKKFTYQEGLKNGGYKSLQ